MSWSLKNTTGSMEGRPVLGVGVPHQVAHEARVERALQMAIEVVRRDEFLQRDGRQRGKDALFRPHHVALLPVGRVIRRRALSSHRCAFFNGLVSF